MESSDAEAAGMVDCGVGTIVWVRRRNGSWWPGKILGPDELSASHLMSPRSGTPVKLLGREDASVDWYNLEKSKRVKPFRCGEFDDCIERAEASQGMPPKKREKYARREDAILHALELEKKLLEKKYGKSGVQTNGLRKDSPASDNGNTQMDEDKRKGPEEQLNIDDKSPEVRPRLRGLQDLAMGGSFNYKLSSMAADSFKHVAADEVLIKTSLEKRKRTQQEGNTSYIEEESLNKRRDRRRPLVQVLKSSVKLAPNIQQLQAVDLHFREEVGNDSYDYTQILSDQVKPVVGLSEENNTTGSNEDTETDSSGTESMMSDTSAALSDEGEEDIEFIPKAFGRSEAALEHESMSEDEEEEDEGEDDDDEDDDDDDDDLGLPEDSGDSLPLLPQQQTSSGVAVSKWQLKGKRNSRRYAERKVVSSGGAWQKEESVGGGGGIISWEEPCLKGGGGYWEQYQDPHQIQFGGRIKSMLIDVDVGVQSGYQREHVPMISLMSKLNDKAIVGHPIPIETLEDSSSDFILLSATATADDEAIGGAGGDLTLQPWRTARRTAKCRVPRPPHLAEDQYEYPADDLDGKGNRKSKKLLKKVQQQHRKSSTSSSNQKIRTLSSIGGSQQQQQQQIPDMERYEEDERVMKPESLPTAVACIPVKLVFSRLHEELVARHQ